MHGVCNIRLTPPSAGASGGQDLSGNDFNFQGAYGTANARLTLASPSRGWELAIYGNNLSDRRFAHTGGTLGGQGTWRWSPTP
jgi:hypothetical protein